MIKIDYTLRQTGNSREFHSTFEHKKLLTRHGILNIIGENGKGKSFLLNLLAFSLKAHQCTSNNIDDLLKAKIASIGDLTKYELRYYIEFHLPNTNTLICCSKEFNEEGKVFRKMENGDSVILGIEQVNKIVEVIYDVPNNIEARLKGVKTDLVDEILIFQKKFQKKTEDFALCNFKIKDVRDEKIIADHSQKIIGFNERISAYSENLEENFKVYSKMSSYKSISELNQLYVNQEVHLQKIESLRVKLRGKKKPVVSSPNHDHIRSLKGQRDDLQTIYRHLLTELERIVTNADYTLFINDLLTLYRDEYNVVSEYTSNSQTSFEDFQGAQKTLVDKIPHIAERYIDKAKLNYVQTIDHLIDLLEAAHEDIYSKLSGVLGNISELMTHLRAEKTLNNVVDFKVVGNSLVKILVDINKHAKEYDKIERQILKSSRASTLSDSDKRLLADIEDLTRLSSRVKEFPTLIATKKREIQLSSTLDGKWLENAELCKTLLESMRSDNVIQEYRELTNYGLDSLKRTRETIEQSRMDLESKIKQSQAFIDNEMQKPQSEVPEESLKQLQGLENLMTKINTRLSQISLTLDESFKGDMLTTEDENNVDIFIGEMIAESLNNVLPLDDRTIQIKLYNFKKDYFLSNEGEKIFLDYVSTGLSSASYLMHKIRSSKGQYNLILLDEVGNMSGPTRNMVISEVEKMAIEGRLLKMLMARVEDGIDLQIMEN